MALRVRSQLSASSWSLFWRRDRQQWLPRTYPWIQSESHPPNCETSNFSELQTRVLCRKIHESLNQQVHQGHPEPARDSRAEKYLSNSNSTYSYGILSCSVPGNYDWRSKEKLQQWCSPRHLLAKQGSSYQCRGSRHSISRNCLLVHQISRTRMLNSRFISSQGERQSESIGTATSAEQPSSAGNEARKKSFADEVDRDPFLQEVRRAAQGGNVTKELETDIDDEDDDARLEKAERDYLEALGKGEVTELDLEQLENLLGEAPTGDATVGTLYLKLGQEYDANGESAEQVLRCGEKALKIFQTKTEDVRLEVAMALHLIAIGYVRQEKYEASLPVLHEALELFESKGGEQSRAAKCAVRFLLGESLSSWGKPDEALSHLRSAVFEQELILGRDHIQLGTSYRKIAEVLANVMNYDEALSFVEKALKIHSKAFGENSVDEAIDRRLLAVIYIGLEEHEKALAEHIIVRKILSTSDYGSQTVFVDISTADTQITLGKYDDAISTLEAALSKVEKGSAMHALALVNLAKVYERQRKPEVANKYAKEVLEILENKDLANSDPLAVAEGFTELAALFEKINQTESAIEMLKKAHAIYSQIPHQRNAVAGTQAQIGMLLFFMGKVEEAVPFLENAVENLESTVGEQNFALAMVLNHLGVANVELERLQAATEHFERAKIIFDEVLGSDHDDTIAVARNLVNTYSLLDRLDDAIKCQKEVISELTLKGDEAKEMLEDAVGHLQMLQEHSDSGKPVSETLASDPRKFGRIISD